MLIFSPLSQIINLQQTLKVYSELQQAGLYDFSQKKNHTRMVNSTLILLCRISFMCKDNNT